MLPIKLKYRSWPILLLTMLLVVISAGPLLAGDGDGSGGGKGVPLGLEASIPADGQTVSDLQPEIELNFNKNVINLAIREANKQCFSLVSSRGEQVPIEVIMADDQLYPEEKRIIRLKPLLELQPGTTYMVKVAPQLQAKNGTSLGHEVSFSFVTEAAVPLPEEAPAPVPIPEAEPAEAPAPVPVPDTEPAETPAPVPVLDTEPAETPAPVPVLDTESAETPAPVPEQVEVPPATPAATVEQTEATLPEQAEDPDNISAADISPAIAEDDRAVSDQENLSLPPPDPVQVQAEPDDPKALPAETSPASSEALPVETNPYRLYLLVAVPVLLAAGGFIYYTKRKKE